MAFEHTISINELSMNDLHLLAGPEEKNIKFLSSFFECTVILRGDTIIVFGDGTIDIEAFKQVIEKMIQFIHLHQMLELLDVEAIAVAVKSETIIALEERTQYTFTKSFSGKPIRPKTEGQYRYMKALKKYDVVFGIGPAGTGKTFLAVARAVDALKNNQVQRIILTRPAVEAGERLGFLPGDLKEKIDPYLRPLYDALFDLLGKESTEKMMEKGVIEIVPLAYMRGRTLDQSYIILDEAQNTTFLQMKMFLTRLGSHAKMVITGDITQIDLPTVSASGLIVAEKTLREINEINFTYLTEKDVVRHPLVEKMIFAFKAHHV